MHVSINEVNFLFFSVNTIPKGAFSPLKKLPLILVHCSYVQYVLTKFTLVCPNLMKHYAFSQRFYKETKQAKYCLPWIEFLCSSAIAWFPKLRAYISVLIMWDAGVFVRYHFQKLLPLMHFLDHNNYNIHFNISFNNDLLADESWGRLVLITPALWLLFYVTILNCLQGSLWYLCGYCILILKLKQNNEKFDMDVTEQSLHLQWGKNIRLVPKCGTSFMTWERQTAQMGGPGWPCNNSMGEEQGQNSSRKQVSHAAHSPALHVWESEVWRCSTSREQDEKWKCCDSGFHIALTCKRAELSLKRER